MYRERNPAADAGSFACNGRARHAFRSTNARSPRGARIRARNRSNGESIIVGHRCHITPYRRHPRALSDDHDPEGRLRAARLSDRFAQRRVLRALFGVWDEHVVGDLAHHPAPLEYEHLAARHFDLRFYRPMTNPSPLRSTSMSGFKAIVSASKCERMRCFSSRRVDLFRRGSATPGERIRE